MPRGLLIFIIAFIIDLVLKSIKDKQKIEKAMNERRKQLKERPDSLEKTVVPIDKRLIMEESYEPLMEEEVVDVNRVEDEIQTNIIYEGPISMVDEIGNSTIYEKEIAPSMEKGIKKRSKSKKDDLKRDVLKGIIYSEILSEPRSIRNMRRGI